MSLVVRRRLLAVIVGAVSIVVLAPAAGSQPRTERFFFLDPAWSHDGGRIALVGGQGSRAHLFVMYADGSGLHEIDTTRPNEPNGVAWPTWSPKDDRIAFSYNERSQDCCFITNLWRIGSDGRDLIRLVRNAMTPEWSPGGRWIAYSRGHDTAGAVIHVIRPDGTNDRAIATPEFELGRSYHDPTWSPDGERLAFSIGAAPDSGSNASGLGIISGHGAPPRFLLPDQSFNDLAWSPSGWEIAFNDDDSFVSLINLRTKRVKRLQPGLSPTWSPDGKRIAFARAGSIYVMNRDGSHLRLLLQGS